MSFFEKLSEAIEHNKTLLCVGLDTDGEKLPRCLLHDEDPVFTFNQRIVEATQDIVCAYKPNLAFYEASGIQGMESLKKTLGVIPPNILVILDAKRGDIGNSARMYARAVFEELGGDAVTVSPYMGFDSVEPFTAYRDRGVYVLSRTSNPGAVDFQDRMIGTKPLYEVVAEKTARWRTEGFHNLGLVIGATQSEVIGRIRRVYPELPLLIPGVGSQGGDLDTVLQESMTSGTAPVIINVSRSILYASSDEDFAEKARDAAEKLRAVMKLYMSGKK